MIVMIVIFVPCVSNGHVEFCIEVASHQSHHMSKESLGLCYKGSTSDLVAKLASVASSHLSLTDKNVSMYKS